VTLKLRIASWIAVVALTIAAALVALNVIPGPLPASYDDGYGNHYSGLMQGAEFIDQTQITYADGSTYTGPLKDGQFDGHGIYHSSQGWTYEGDFSAGEPTTPGQFTS
jgi:hypothetical protein